MVAPSRSPVLLTPPTPLPFDLHPNVPSKHSRESSAFPTPPVSYHGLGVDQAERNSSESTIVSIYSMYTERRASWSASASPSTTPPSSTYLTPSEFPPNTVQRRRTRELTRKSDVNVGDPSLADSNSGLSSVFARASPEHPHQRASSSGRPVSHGSRKSDECVVKQPYCPTSLITSPQTNAAASFIKSKRVATYLSCPTTHRSFSNYV